MSTQTVQPRGVLRRTVRRLDILAGPHGLDRYLELVAPTWSTAEVRGRITHVAHPTADSVTLTIEPNANWTGFIPGQHTQVTVEIDGVRHTRYYSMATAPGGPGPFQLTVKAHPGGTVSRYLKHHAVPGLVVGLAPADGDFTLPAARPAHVVMISGGSGITPVLALARQLCAEGHAGPVTFVHYARTPDDLVHGDDLAALAADHPNLQVVRIFTRAPGRGDRDGRLSVDQLDAIDPDWRTAETYLCGPENLLDEARRIFDTEGLTDRLHTEAFTIAAIAPAGAGGGTLHLAATDRTLVDDGRPILVQAEEAGLSPAHGCRIGICHTCPRRLTAGTVRNLVTGECTTATNDHQPTVRICVSAPAGDVAIDL